MHPFFLFALLHCPVHMAGYEKSHSLLLAILSQDLAKISHPLVLMHEYPGIRNTSEFSVISIAEMLAVSPTNVTLAACLSGIVFSIGIL